MTARKRRPNIRRSPITRSKWDKMLAAYRERPTIKHVSQAGEVGMKTARRAVNEGWPDLNLPPFIELAASGSNVHKEMAVMRESWEESALTQGEAARMAAEEGLAARITMDAAVRSMRMSQTYAERILEKIDEGEMIIPEKVTPRLVQSLIRSMESASNIVEKAMKIERMRAGEPEKTLGIQIGIMLEKCTLEELSEVASTGHMPARVLGHREAVKEAVAPPIDAEFEESDTVDNGEGNEADEPGYGEE